MQAFGIARVYMDQKVISLEQIRYQKFTATGLNNLHGKKKGKKKMRLIRRPHDKKNWNKKRRADDTCRIRTCERERM